MLLTSLNSLPRQLASVSIPFKSNISYEEIGISQLYHVLVGNDWVDLAPEL